MTGTKGDFILVIPLGVPATPGLSPEDGVLIMPADLIAWTKQDDKPAADSRKNRWFTRLLERFGTT